MLLITSTSVGYSELDATKLILRHHHKYVSKIGVYKYDNLEIRYVFIVSEDTFCKTWFQQVRHYTCSYSPKEWYHYSISFSFS